MATGLTLDAGALIAADKNDRRIWTLLKEAVLRNAVVTVAPVVIAQAWRSNHPRMAQALAGCDTDYLYEGEAKEAGRLLAESRTVDVVDALVVLGAIRRRDCIVTSDAKDIERLIDASCRRNGDEIVLHDRPGPKLVPLRSVVRVLAV